MQQDKMLLMIMVTACARSLKPMLSGLYRALEPNGEVSHQ